MRDVYISRRAATLAALRAGDVGRADALARPAAGDPGDEDADIQELEDLLETYFAQARAGEVVGYREK